MVAGGSDYEAVCVAGLKVGEGADSVGVVAVHHYHVTRGVGRSAVDGIGHYPA